MRSLLPLFFVGVLFITPIFVHSARLPVVPDQITERETEYAYDTENRKAAETQVYKGNGYWFEQHGHAGACGKVHQDTDFIVALQTSTYANGRNCGRKVEITDETSKRKVIAAVADMCPSCSFTQDLDMSKGLFTEFADTGKGKLNVKWHFLN